MQQMLLIGQTNVMFDVAYDQNYYDIVLNVLYTMHLVFFYSLKAPSPQFWHQVKYFFFHFLITQILLVTLLVHLQPPIPIMRAGPVKM